MADSSEGGERPLHPSRLSSPLLRARGGAVARYCFAKCYETWPDLNQRHGARGRHYAAQDNYWHLEHLDAAVTLDSPKIFEDYADWLVGLLLARGLEREHVAGTFGFLAEGLERVECPAELLGHRREIVALLRDNAARILQTSAVG
ncbi:MAG TPA: hypothetical protein VF590_27540 [Isosphaeraceae bacterium]|jgi:hypothetical protein